MTDNELIQQEAALQQKAKELLEASQLENLLVHLGEVKLVGSYKAGLMVKPDIDFSIFTEEPSPRILIDLEPKLYTTFPGLFQLEFYDHERKGTHLAYYLGAKVLYGGLEWQIDITVCRPQDSEFDYPKVEAWIKSMTSEQKAAILRLKTRLINEGRYLGAKSRPPKSFRSIHVYEAVFEGKARNIIDLENYFSMKT